jgi:predicted transcriptional regulator of viral defense system
MVYPQNRPPSELPVLLAATGRSSFATGEIAQALGISAARERALIRDLTREGSLFPVQRGRYILRPPNYRFAPWSPTEALSLKSLVLDAGGRYQLCGPSAFQHFGWDDQIPNRAYAYNNRISGERTVGAVVLTLIKVDLSRLGATGVSITPEGIELVWPTRARALLDSVYDWSRFNSLPRGYDWIRRELQRDDAFAADLVDVSLRFANQGALRRIGKLLETADAPAGLLRRLERRVQPSTSFIPWDPTHPKRGTIDRRWGVVFNHES